MKIAVITLFPEMLAAISQYGVSGRAFKQGLVTLKSFNPRDFTADKHQTVDDRPYGGGPGMVMLIEPLRAAIQAAKEWIEDSTIVDSTTVASDTTQQEAKTPQAAKVVYLSPQGRLIDQALLSNCVDAGEALIFIAGRYEGIDERLIELEVDEEWSIGDYVLSGGELPAMVAIDAMVRLIPGVLGDEQSAQQDSFVAGLLDCPHYTRPEDYQGKAVPDILLSGDHEKIRRWRLQQSLRRTQARRPDLLNKLNLSVEQQRLLDENNN